MDLATFDFSVLLAPLLLVMIGIAGIVWIAMLGGSLQFSLWLCDKTPGYLRCLVMALLMIVINVGVFVGFYLLLGPQPWYILSAYQVFLQILMVMMIARCNPVSAFLAALCHSFCSSVGTVALIFIMFFTCGSAISGAMEQQKNIAQQRGPVQTMNPYAQ